MASLHLLETAHVDAVHCVHVAHANTDAETAEHEDSVSKLSEHLALHMNASEDEALTIGTAARLHDVGKVAIPPAILLKPARLSSEERMVMEQHTSAGAKILTSTGFPIMRLAGQIAYEHHEYADGSGYPRGLKGKDLGIAPRIVTVCDVYDAIRRKRPYKEQIPHEEACRLLSEGDDRIYPDMFDERVLSAFMDNHKHLEAVFEKYQA